MPSEADIRAAIELLGPGFLALKIFQLLAAERTGRSQWEWTIWSVLVSLPIALTAGWLADLASTLRLVEVYPYEVALRFGVALGVSVVAVAGWRRIVRSRGRAARWLLRATTNSAWDRVAEDADLYGRSMEAAMKGGASYRGHLAFGGREDTGAEGWLYLTHPRIHDGTSFVRQKTAHGILIRRDDIERLTVYRGAKPRDPDGLDAPDPLDDQAEVAATGVDAAG